MAPPSLYRPTGICSVDNRALKTVPFVVGGHELPPAAVHLALSGIRVSRARLTRRNLLDQANLRRGDRPRIPLFQLRRRHDDFVIPGASAVSRGTICNTSLNGLRWGGGRQPT